MMAALATAILALRTLGIVRLIGRHTFHGFLNIISECQLVFYAVFRHDLNVVLFLVFR